MWREAGRGSASDAPDAAASAWVSDAAVSVRVWDAVSVRVWVDLAEVQVSA